VLDETARRAQLYASLPGGDRRTHCSEIARLDHLAGPSSGRANHPPDVWSLLDDYGSPATVVSTATVFRIRNRRTLPAALAANWLAAVWDQTARSAVIVAVAARLEEISARLAARTVRSRSRVWMWLRDRPPLWRISPDPPPLAMPYWREPAGMSKDQGLVWRPEIRSWWEPRYTSHS